jgi:hypothetical protein
MKTELYVWLDPLVMNHQRCNEKVYFNVVVSGDYSKASGEELDSLLESKISDIMDFADINPNNDFGVVSATVLPEECLKDYIEFAESPKQKKSKADEQKAKAEIEKVVASKEPIELSKDNLDIKESGIIEVSIPSLKIKQEINFPKIWESIEKHIQGKIKEGDVIQLTDDDGNVLFEVWGGSFLNVGLADLSVYDSEKMIPNASIFNKGVGLKGGLFIRDDGSIDIGDTERTFYIKIYTNKMLKQSLKLGKSLNEITEIKLIDNADNNRKRRS